MTTARSVLAGLRLLVVEDEFLIAEHIEDQLDSLGCEVAGPVATIEDALAAIKCEVLQGALLDANLHDDSSAPIAAALGAAGIPFVVATGYGGRTLPDEILDRAPRLIKPFSETELETVLIAAIIR
jgi:DNA-binding LytR/AlgR family response regulator